MLINKKYLGLGLLGLGLASSTIAFANDSKLSSTGGLMFGSPKDAYWFKIGGQGKFDLTYIDGSDVNKGSEFRSNAALRSASLDLNGGFGEDFMYTLALDMSSDRSINITDAYITYKGIKTFGENFNVYLGQINPAFSLENTVSSKWLPFLERSLPATTFGPRQGVGAGFLKWGERYSFGATITVPKQGDETSTGKADLIGVGARLVYVHFKAAENQLFQVGVSAHTENKRTTTIFMPYPEARVRNSAAATVVTTGTSALQASRVTTFDVELSGQNGPLYGEVEYQRAKVNRHADQGGSLTFDGYHAQVAYVLTGESRTYKPELKHFAQVKPESEGGAWEIAARYSRINLKDKDIDGGDAKNITLGVNWYLTNNVKISANYIKSKLRAANSDTKRNLNIIGTRFQFVF